MSTVPQFISLLSAKGSDVLFHRDDSMVACPCRTPEGFRDPVWHLDNPLAPVCNEAGMLPGGGTVELTVKAFVQPIQSTRATRLQSELIQAMFGEIQSDDHLGIFPIEWNNVILNFSGWGRSGEDFIIYNGNKYTVVNVNVIPDPDDGNPNHHTEVALRLVQ